MRSTGDTFTEVNGEFRHLSDDPSCVTLRIIFPVSGWISGNGSVVLTNRLNCGMERHAYDTIGVKTLPPPDGAFNGKSLSDGGYGDPVGTGNNVFLSLVRHRNRWTG